MNIDLKNPGHVKLLLLSRGVRFSEDALSEVGSRFAENRYFYGSANDPEKFSRHLPSTILLPCEVEANLFFNPDSELKIKAKEGALALFYNDAFVSPVGFIPRPAFFGEKINERVSSEQVVSMYGRRILGLFSNAYCYFFKRGLQCKFCSLQPTRSAEGGKNVFVVTPTLAREAVKRALECESEAIKYIIYTCGTHVSEERSYREQAALIRVVSPLYPIREAHHITIFPTLKEALLREIYDAGLGSICFTMEVFDKALFKEYCPGKDQDFGYDRFLQSYQLAREVFGQGGVFAGFVGGLEPLDSLEEAMHYFGERGVTPAINVFHPDPNTPLSNHPRPSVDYLFKMVAAQSKVFKKYQLKPLFPQGGRRSSLDTEVGRGFFD